MSSRNSFDSEGGQSSILSRSTSQLDLPALPASSAAFQRLRPRRGSNASSILSLNSSATALDWKGAREAGPASISALVDNTSSRTVIPRPTTRDIPPVNLTPIPKLKPSDFAQYLAIAGEYEKYRRAKDQGLEEHLRLARNEVISPSPSIAELTGLPSISSYNDSPVKKRRNNLSATPLSTVPSVYFDSNFRLENPRIFDVVSERSDIIRQASPPASEISSFSGHSKKPSEVGTRKALASNAILQEKLSWYMDTVEVHLIASISTASNSFFAALGDLRDLHSEAATSVSKIEVLRSQLKEIDDAQAVKGLEIVRLRKRRDNVVKLAKAVKQMEDVIGGFQEAERLLASGEVSEALEKVEQIEALMAGQGPPDAYLVDLRQARALEPIHNNMEDLRHRIGAGFQKQFVETLLADLREHVKKVPTNDTLQRFTRSFQRDQQRLNRRSTDGMLSPAIAPPTFSELPDNLRFKLKQHLTNLQKAQHISSAIQAYRDEVSKELKILIRQYLPSDDDNDSMMSGKSGTTTRGGRGRVEKGAALARAIRNLGPIEAEELLTQTYVGVSELTRRLGTQQKLLLDVTMTLGETQVGGMLSPPLVQTTPGFFNGRPSQNGGSVANQEDAAAVVFSGLSDIIAPVLEAALGRLVKVVRIRKELVSRYPPADFYRYLTLNKLFSSECEAVSGRIPSGLQTVIGDQIIEFTKSSSSELQSALANMMEKEKWAGKDFDEVHQNILARILEGATRDPEWWSRHTILYENTRATPEPKDPIEHLAKQSLDPKDKIRHAIVDEQRYVLPGASLVILAGIEKYLEMIVMIPNMATEIATNMLDYISIFNTRARQLILLAGATQSAGLKHITTKHLAIASQALSFTIALLPYTRECLRRHARGSIPTVMTKFDMIKRDLQEHQSTIHDKFISLMTDRVAVHIQTILAHPWDTVTSDPPPVNAYMEALVKATSVLYKVLDRYLPEGTVVYVMGRIFASYRTLLVAEGYAPVVIRSEAGLKSMIRDVEYFCEKLAGFKGCGNSGEIIAEAVRNKVIEEAPVQAPAPAPEEGRGKEETNGTG